jgi:uncharacterized protein
MPPSDRVVATPSAGPHRAPDGLELASNQLELVREILQRHVPGLEVRAFGSRTASSARPASDLDLLIMSDEPLQPRIVGLLADAFAESDLPFKVDVVDASLVPEDFRARALEGSIVVQIR